MKTNRIILIAMIVTVVAALSAVLITAQDSTAEPESTAIPSSFSDNRINGDIYLAGLAVYCVDENNSTDTTTFQNGGITVWGADGQKYIELTADQLRGNEEISQPVAPMEMTEEAVSPAATPMPSPTVEAMATEDMMVEPVLLARAETMNGTIWLFRISDDVFALQGSDEYGKFYTYIWTGCSRGVLSTETAPFAGLDFTGSDMESMATAEVMLAETMMPTEEATAQS